ncbi:hypothetical protein BKP45_14845 [Anaerobacillus alkalidiazotrophicus]|uniref:Small, acid-soluble spore protein N n=1 Tax=Anaerobacillus alkalidiazotrophicus TaxID=472963 RepID=A0A1S2M2U0_9BACI|nr:hypothetical protein [Anaerobacillus alkalidiazotrophicus]OIJ18998.1 hypothetical protein BKP45_14845 [Anaerobacillus alkalidiazotrophicus]
MPYIKNKQQAFQAAQQAFVQAQQATNNLIPNDEDFGHHFKQAEQEVMEAEQVIDKALRNASEHQRHELEKFQNELAEIKGNLDRMS